MGTISSLHTGLNFVLGEIEMSNAGKTILVVDDESDVVEYLTTLFKDQAYRVITAGTGAEATQIAMEEHPDLITLDITMPEESGVRAYRDLRGSEETKDIPIVIITGYEDPNFRKFIYTRRSAPPPDAYFEKPIDRDKLLEEVKRLLLG